MAIPPYPGGRIFTYSKFPQIHPSYHALQKGHNFLLLRFW